MRAVLAAVFCCAASVAGAQARTPGLLDSFTDPGGSGLLGQKLDYLAPDGTPTERGKSISETLQGNGTGLGYMLSHGGIIPDSLRISAGFRTLRPGIDYLLDAANGSISLLDTVRKSHSIHVSYRYVETADANRSPLGLQGLRLDLKGGSSLNFGYGVSADKASGLSFTTYGLSLHSKPGTSGLNGLFYMSAPASNARNMVDGPARLRSTAAPKAPDLKAAATDHLIAQNLNLKNGAASFRATYQDVGMKFSGFQALRLENAKNTDALAQLATLEKEKGLKRVGFGTALNTGKTSNMGLDWDQIQDGSSRIVKQGLGLNAGKFQFNYNSRNIGEKFGRLKDLSDQEKTGLALDIRRQYNPTAAAAEVTAKDKEQIVQDAGLTRARLSMTAAMGKNSAFGFSQVGIGDGKGKLNRQAFDLNTSTVSFRFVDQNISEGFSALSKMSDFEKSQLGNEKGIHRNSFAFGLMPKKGSAVGFSQLKLSDKTGGLMRRALTYDAKGVSFKLASAETAKAFARSADLAMPDPEKKGIEAERGYKSSDITAKVTAIKGLALDSYSYNGSNIADQLTKSLFKHNMVWNPSKGAALTYLTEGNALFKAGTVQDRKVHDLLSFCEETKRGIKFNMFHDTLESVAGGKVQPTVATDFLHYEMNRTKPTNLMLEEKLIRRSDGTFEDTSQVDLNMVPSKRLSLRVNALRIDRGKDPSLDTETMAFKLGLTKTLNLTGQVAETTTNNKENVTATTIGLNGPVNKDVNVAATTTKVDQHQKNVKTVTDVAVNNTKPANLLGAKNVTLTAKYAMTEDQKKKQTESVTGMLEGTYAKNKISLGYVGALDVKGNSAIARTGSFASDPNPKRPVHIDMTYRARNINRGDLALVRKYNATVRVDKRTHVAYTYISLPEDPAGTMQQTKAATFALKRGLTKMMNLSLDYSSTKDMTKKNSISKCAAVASGKINDKTTVQMSYSVDITNQDNKRTNSHTVGISFDRQIDGDHFITLATTYVRNLQNTPDEILANIDFKTKF